MHDAKQTLLSKIEVGQTILVTPDNPPGVRGFGRPKDTTAVPLAVTDKAFAPDQWSGKVWTLTLSDKTKTEGRYGTTHVYVTEAKAAKPKAKARKKAEPQVEQLPEVEVETESGTKRVIVGPDRIPRIKDWTGGELYETTPHGKSIRIAADGVITVLDSTPEGVVTERPAVIEPDDDDESESMSEAEAQRVVESDRCGQCKGFGVVRKRGSHAGESYRTAAGADQATANGNSVICPVCKGEALVSRSA